MADQEIEIVYHVFTDHEDYWFADYRLARKLYNYFKCAYGRARLYEERYYDRANDDMESENCLLSFGPFPW